MVNCGQACSLHQGTRISEMAISTILTDPVTQLDLGNHVADVSPAGLIALVDCRLVCGTVVVDLHVTPESRARHSEGPC